MKRYKVIDALPEYPTTLHLPWNPNSKGDRIAMESDAMVIFNNDNLYIQEKIDGANCGMSLFQGYPEIRSRTKILSKGRELKNPSQQQFANAFNWFYKNKYKFEKLNFICGNEVSVYGEWMVQQHGMVYDQLPDWFIAFDVYDYYVGKFYDPNLAYSYLTDAGFDAIEPKKYKISDSKELEDLSNLPSDYAAGKREGIYLKVSDGDWITHRFKMVRQGFEQGCLLGETIKRNILK